MISTEGLAAFYGGNFHGKCDNFLALFPPMFAFFGLFSEGKMVPLNFDSIAIFEMCEDHDF